MLYADVTPPPSLSLPLSHYNVLPFQQVVAPSLDHYTRPPCPRFALLLLPLPAIRRSRRSYLLARFEHYVFFPHLPSASSLFLLLLLFLGLLRARAFAFGLSFCSFCFILFALVINVMNLLHAPPRPLPASRPPTPPSPPISCCCPAHLLYYLGSSFYCNDMKHTRHARFKCSALLLIPCNWHLASGVVAYKIHIYSPQDF